MKLPFIYPTIWKFWICFKKKFLINDFNWNYYIYGFFIVINYWCDLKNTNKNKWILEHFYYVLLPTILKRPLSVICTTAYFLIYFYSEEPVNLFFESLIGEVRWWSWKLPIYIRRKISCIYQSISNRFLSMNEVVTITGVAKLK